MRFASRPMDRMRGMGTEPSGSEAEATRPDLITRRLGEGYFSGP